jgi:putative peptidoglycan lipid II flippase
MSKKRIVKSALTVSLMTAVSRVFGYVRDATLAAVLGAGFSMDAFTVAFRIANLLRRLVAEGSMTAAFVPVFTRYKTEHSEEDLWDFANKMFYTLSAVLVVITIAGIIFSPLIVKIMAPGFTDIEGKVALTVLLNRILAPYILFIGLAALAMAILNSLGHFGIPSFTPVLLNISIIVCTLLFAPFFKQPAVATAIGALIGGALQVGIQIPLLLKKGMTFRFGISFTHPAVRKVGQLIVPGIFGIGVTQIQLLFGSLIASFLAQGAVSSLYYSDRVMELVLGVFVISLSIVILPEMSKRASVNDMNGLKDLLSFSLRMVSFETIPAAVGLIVLRVPIIKVLFQHGKFTAADTESTAFALLFFSVGLFFFAGIKVVAPAFYSLHDMKTPVKAAWISLVINVILSLILMKPLRQGGIALAMSAAAAVNMLHLLYVFRKRHGRLELKSIAVSILKITAAALIMGAVSALVITLTRFHDRAGIAAQALSLLAAILAGVGTFGVCSHLFGCGEMKEIMKFRSLMKKTVEG